MKIQRFILWVTVLATAGMLTSCSIIPQAAPTTIYQLPTASIETNGAKQLNVTLCIAQPQASGLLESARIAVIPQENILSAYPDVRWQSPTPTLLQEYLLDAFQRAENIASIISDKQDLYADYRLDSILHAFHAEYNRGTAQVEIVLDVTLANKVTKRILCSRRFTAQLPVNAEQVPQVVATLGRACNTIANELTVWVYQALHQQISPVTPEKQNS
ncbi:MAG: ABC-type transport auxiliary lipoprotein family protein [Desulfuromonas sp.]|nr:ABC-type transport auxiliary lipoprotein family protein [Desulfuromonas sp.]